MEENIEEIIEELLNKSYKETTVDAYRKLLNEYALENVVMGRLHPNDEVPFEQFVRELSPRAQAPENFKDSVSGEIINADGRIADLCLRKFIRIFFVNKMNEIFEKVPHKKIYPDHVGLYYYQYGLTNYVESLYPLFVEILNTNVENMSLSYNQSRDFCMLYDHSAKYSAGFFRTLLTTGLRPYSQIDRFARNILLGFPFVERLFINNGNHFLMTDFDRDDLEVELALISSIRLLNYDHQKILNKKILVWTMQQVQ